MNERCKKIGRIAMGVVLADTIKPESNSRMGNLCRKLRKRCKHHISFIMVIEEEKKEILKNIEDFKKETAWDKNGKRIETYAAFVLELLDSENNVTGIIEAINDICSFLDQAETAPTPCNWSGALAFEKWNQVWEG